MKPVIVPTRWMMGFLVEFRWTSATTVYGPFFRRLMGTDSMSFVKNIGVSRVSMYSYVEGIMLPDDKWNKMKAVYDSCSIAGIPIPNEVNSFFNGEGPDDKGIIIAFERLKALGAVKSWDDGDMRVGFEVTLEKLPPGIKIIRFVNSY